MSQLEIMAYNTLINIIAVFYITISRFDFFMVIPSQEHKPNENILNKIAERLFQKTTAF